MGGDDLGSDDEYLAAPMGGVGDYVDDSSVDDEEQQQQKEIRTQRKEPGH